MVTTKQAKKRDDCGRFVKGYTANPGGVPKGTRQKATLIKEAFMDAFHKTGGLLGLIKWIEESKWNQKEFYKMLLTIMPKDIDIKGEGMGETKIIIIRDKENAKRERITDTA